MYESYTLNPMMLGLVPKSSKKDLLLGKFRLTPRKKAARMEMVERMRFGGEEAPAGWWDEPRYRYDGDRPIELPTNREILEKKLEREAEKRMNVNLAREQIAERRNMLRQDMQNQMAEQYTMQQQMRPPTMREMLNMDIQRDIAVAQARNQKPINLSDWYAMQATSPEEFERRIGLEPAPPTLQEFMGALGTMQGGGNRREILQTGAGQPVAPNEMQMAYRFKAPFGDITMTQRPKEEKQWQPMVIENRETGEQKFINPGEVIESGWQVVRPSAIDLTLNQKPAPGAMLTNLSGLFNLQNMTYEIEKLLPYAESELGYLVNKWESFKEKYNIPSWIGERPTEAGTLLRQITWSINNQLLALRSGAAISEHEYMRLMKAMPSPDLPADTFKYRLKGFQIELQNTIKSRQSVLTQSGYIAPTSQQETDEELLNSLRY